MIPKAERPEVSAARTSKSLLIALVLTCLLDTYSAAAAAGDPPRPQPVRDPRYGLALFDYYQGHYFDAITDIMVAQARAPITQQGNDPQLLLGSLYLSYGMHEAAAAIFQQLLDGAINPYNHDLAWFYLGKMRYQDGRFAEALTALATVGDTLPTDKDAERRHLMINAQLHEKNYDAALNSLEGLEHGGIWNAYSLYNIGTTLIRAGRAQEAVILLHRLGQVEPRDEEQYALRDKANMAIGYAALKEGGLVDPAASFSRVRLSGPFSNQALLGMGWAHYLRDLPQEALIPWFELRGRAPDLATQEGLLAIPYTLEKLGAPEMALTYYQNAIASYDQERATLATALSATDYARLLQTSVTSPSDPARPTLADQLAELPAARYMYDIVSSAEFQQTYRDYRDLHYLYAQARQWQEKIPLLQSMLEDRRRHYTTNLEKIGTSDYARRLADLNRQHAAFSEKIANIERNETIWALADHKEREADQQLLEIKSSLDALSTHGLDVTAEMKKFGILHGMLQWRLRTEFPQRLWRLKREQRALDYDLEQTARAQSALDAVLKLTPLNFDGHAKRISDIETTLVKLTLQLDASIARQEQYCTALITEALSARKRQIEAYRSRALYAQARLYDQINHDASPP